jgi:hypothetical protein
MTTTEDRIRDALLERAGAPSPRSMPAATAGRVRTRQTVWVATVGSFAAVALAVLVVAYGTVGSAPVPKPTFDPAADGFTSPLEDVPPHWPAVNIGDPADAWVPKLTDPHVVDGPAVLASGSVEGSRFTLYAYTERRGDATSACLGFVGFAAPGEPTRSAPDMATCSNAPAVPEERDVAFIGASSGDGRLEANFGFVSRRADVVYVWGGGRYGMFEITKLPSLDGWNVDPFFFVPAPDAGPLEVDARVHGGVEELAHAEICGPSNVPGGCRTDVVQDLPLDSPVDVPLPLEAGARPIVTYGGDFEPYIDHEMNAEGVRDPGVVGAKTVIAYGTVQGAPWSLVAYNTRMTHAPDGVNPASDLFITGVGGGGAALYETTPWRPNDIGAGRMNGGGQNFDSLPGVVSSRVAGVRLELADGTVRTLDLIPGPSGVAAQYFVTFLPHDVAGRLVALDASGQEIEQMCLRDMMGVPPGGDPCA